MSKLVVFVIIMLISLLIGGVSSGIYVAVIRSRDEQQNKQQALRGEEQTTTSIAPVVSFIMITSALLGLLVFGIYYLVTMEEAPPKPCPPCPKCAKCVISEDDFVNLRKAEREIVNFQEKANLVPDIAVQETCSKRSPGVAGGACGNFFKQSPMANPVAVPATPGQKAVLSPQVPYIPIRKPVDTSPLRLERPVQRQNNILKDRLARRSPEMKLGNIV